MKFFVSLLLGLSLLSSGFFISGCKAPAKTAETKKEAAPATKEVVKEAAAAPETAAPAKEPVKEAVAAPETPKPAQQVKETTPPAAAEVAVDPEKVVVTLNGTPIREKEVSAECDKRADAQAAQMAAKGWPSDESSKKMLRDYFRDTVLDTLMERALIAEQLKINKIEITDADVDARFLEMIKEAGRTLEQAEEDLKQQNRTIKDVKGQIYWHVGIEKLFNTLAKEKNVTEADAKKYYDENPTYFVQPEQVRASHILIKTEGMDEAAKAEAKKKIEDILKKARGGEDFAALAKTYTEDPGSKDTGGEYTFPKGKMVPAFETAAFALEPNQISDVVETQFGYHIIKLSEKIPAKTWSFDEVKTRLIADMKRQKIGQFWNQFVGDVRKVAKIEWAPEEKARRDQKEKEKQQQQQQMEIPPQPQTEQK
jgi:peptidyl-prolyl cis-trans isomerase C